MFKLGYIIASALLTAKTELIVEVIQLIPIYKKIGKCLYNGKVITEEIIRDCQEHQIGVLNTNRGALSCYITEKLTGVNIDKTLEDFKRLQMIREQGAEVIRTYIEGLK